MKLQSIKTDKKMKPLLPSDLMPILESTGFEQVLPDSGQLLFDKNLKAVDGSPVLPFLKVHIAFSGDTADNSKSVAVNLLAIFDKIKYDPQTDAASGVKLYTLLSTELTEEGIISLHEVIRGFSFM